MRAHALKSKLISFAVMALLVLGAAPGRILADDKASSGSPADAEKTATTKPANNKIEAPAPLTERERWLLDRVEQLEKRVAELEAKSNSGVAAPSETIAAQPATPSAVPSTTVATNAASPSPATAAATSAVTTQPASTEASANVATGHPLAALATQDQAAPGKPAKAEPFAFADFTWLNGNARTKDLAMDTKFFTP